MLKDFFLGFIKIHILYHASRDPIHGIQFTESRYWRNWSGMDTG